MKKTLTSFVLLCLSLCAWAQVEQPAGYLSNYIIVRGDTMPLTLLDEVAVYDTLYPKSWEEKRAYYILRKKVLKVYPYAKIAADRLTEIDSTRATITKKRKQKKYSKEVEQFIRDEFEAELRKLTRSEGQILIQLIYRNTGISAYDLMKEYRGWLRANFYQTLARWYDADMRKEYHPEKYRRDALIEYILRGAFADGILEE